MSTPAGTAVAKLVLASDHLLPLGDVPMLEPISGAADYPIVTATQAVDIIEQVDAVAGRHGALGLLADLYHLAANGEDIHAVLRQHSERIVHVQVGDFPGEGTSNGRAAALTYAREGARVLVADLDEESAAETQNQVRREGGVC